MRRHIQELPDDLPNARLYLDDIEAITKTLSTAVEETAAAYQAELAGIALSGKNKLPAVPLVVKVIYKIGQDEMDSIQDLLDQGGSVTNLEVKVFEASSPWASCSLRFHWLATPALSLGGVRDGNKAWEVHAKIREVFEKNSLAVKNFVEDLPSSFKFGAWLLVTLGNLAIPLSKGAAHRVLDVVWGTFSLMFLLGLAAVFRPNRVYLVRRHEQSRTKSEMRSKFVKGAIIFVLGAVVSKFVDYLYTHFVK